MAHNSLIRNPVTLWASSPTVLDAELVALDNEQAGGIDGDAGGVWAPAVAINIGGSGLQTSVPVAIFRGGVLIFDTGASITLGDGDFPTLGPTHTGRSRTIIHPTAIAKGVPSWMWRTRKEDAGFQAYAPNWTYAKGGTSTPTQCAALVPIRGYDGVTLSSIVIYFRVGVPHTSPPSTMPSARIVRMDKFGNVTPLTSQAAGADVNGFVFVAPASSGPGWYALGATQTLTIQCDQNNVIDVDNYDYHVEIIEEGGLTGIGNVLDKLASPSFYNGLLSGGSLPTLWTGPTWAASTSFATNKIVFPTKAQLDSAIYFQNQGGTASSGSTEPVWPTGLTTTDPVTGKVTASTIVDGSITWTAVGSTQKFGNIWQAVAVNYTNIPDTHWQ